MLSSIRILFLIRNPQSEFRNQTCGGFEVARTNAPVARACVASSGYKKTRKLNGGRGARAGTDVATVGGRVSKEVLPRGDARVGEPYGNDTARLTTFL